MPYTLQQSYQPANGMVGNGFASRGMADSRRNMAIPTLPTISTSLYDDSKTHLLSPLPTSRGSSRAQLLAGLRTAPKTPMGAEHVNALDGSHHDDPSQVTPVDLNSPYKNQRMFTQGGRGPISHGNMPTNMARSLLLQEQFQDMNLGGFASPPTPPASTGLSYQGDVDYEAKLYADLLARNISLAQQQQLLQQMIVSQQAQQLQKANQQVHAVHVQPSGVPSYSAPLMSPTVYSPSAARHQPSHPHNSSNSQHFYLSQQARNMHGAPQGYPASDSMSVATLASGSQVSLSSSPATESPARTSSSRSSPSPTRGSPNGERPRMQKTPSPPPVSLSKFRRGHKKCISLSGCNNMNPALADSGPKTSLPRFSNVPSTPLNSTFGGRGDHPIRQPRGPPALEEIVSKPSSKHEGSKNFSSRQRRRALTKLVNAGLERRGTKPLGQGPGSDSDVASHSSLNTPVDNMGRGGVDGYATASAEPPNTKRDCLITPSSNGDRADKRRSAIF
ncbi:hypothetical protein Dda_7776 [Drechslerella dactyloides]|uniref:Uncharacterized protein n=1 Tax=Drechslerella dactyloides TaxID=74499 RepID=A0AAD6IWG4_DREDA|nr:hypothetical protein Dda_7776 [Drechslerella dactyloides]